MFPQAYISCLRLFVFVLSLVDRSLVQMEFIISKNSGASTYLYYMFTFIDPANIKQHSVSLQLLINISFPSTFDVQLFHVSSRLFVELLYRWL